MKPVEIDWSSIRRILVVRLRSIGDTVLCTPSLSALKHFAPQAKIDVLLEDWVAPLLDGFNDVDNVLSVGKSGRSRLDLALSLRVNKYDIAYNLHGGTTGTFFTSASRAKHRFGFAEYQYSFLYNHLLSSTADFWQRSPNHSVEQQLALIGFSGVALPKNTATHLAVTKKAAETISTRLHENEINNGEKLVLIHPAAAFAEKQWDAAKFALVADRLVDSGYHIVAVAAPNESNVLVDLQKAAKNDLVKFTDLTLPEITALASRAELFIGNDSGIAHIAAAVDTPTVVIFGSSNIDHWRPWSRVPSKIVYSQKQCNHWKGNTNSGLSDPKCIKCVEIRQVVEAIDEIGFKI